VSAASRRGVSELVGFVLVFSLVIAVVGIVSVAGLDTLANARDVEQVNNAERAMEVLADNMADIHERGAPSRATEISLGDAQLFMDEEIEITVENTGSPAFTETFTVRPIVYDGPDDTRLVYVMGAIYRVQPDGGVVLREWSAVTDEKYVTLPIVNTISSTGGSQSLQSSTVLVRANEKSRRLVRANTAGDVDANEITITVETPRNDLWEEMLSERPGFVACDTSTGPDAVECELASSPRTFYLTETRISVAIKQ